MVVWVFAGGGYTEFGGLTIFLERNFPAHRFIRKTPVRQKPGPKPGKDNHFHVFGQTGRGLAEQITHFLSLSNPAEHFEALLILDDLDCHDMHERTEMFVEAVEQTGTFTNINRLIGFAKPEIEAWLVADWDRTFAGNKEFHTDRVNIRRELSRAYRELTESGNIANPENFSHYDEPKDACREKLSDTIIQIVLDETGIHYSKAIHSALMLRDARAAIISEKCPVFRDLYRQLMNLSDDLSNE